MEGEPVDDRGDETGVGDDVALFERLIGQRLQRLAVKSTVLGDREEPASDMALHVVGLPDAVQQFVEFSHCRDVRNRDKRPPAEPANLSFDPALLMGALHAREAEERVEPIVGAHQHEPLGLDPILTAQHLRNGGIQVVVADPGRHPAEVFERSDVTV